LRSISATTRPPLGQTPAAGRAYLPWIIGLSMLNTLGIDWFNRLTTLDFAVSQSVRDGTETLSYSYRLMVGFAPRGDAADLAAAASDFLVLVGDRNDAFLPTNSAKSYRRHRVRSCGCCPV